MDTIGINKPSKQWILENEALFIRLSKNVTGMLPGQAVNWLFDRLQDSYESMEALRRHIDTLKAGYFNNHYTVVGCGHTNHRVVGKSTSPMTGRKAEVVDCPDCKQRFRIEIEPRVGDRVKFIGSFDGHPPEGDMQNYLVGRTGVLANNTGDEAWDYFMLLDVKPGDLAITVGVDRDQIDFE